jgi:hypothetical protein
MRWNLVSLVWWLHRSLSVQTLEDDYKRWLRSGEKKRRRSSIPQSTVREPKKIFKYYSEFYLLKITFLIHLCDWALYVWTSLHTRWVRTATGFRTIRESSIHVGSAPLNPHLPTGVPFLRRREYWGHGATVFEYRSFTVWRIIPGLVVWRGSLIFVYIGDGHWRRLDLIAHARLVQEVELQEQTRREREN